MYLVAFFIIALDILLLKNLRYREYSCDPYRPVLKVWMILLAVIIFAIPYANIIIGGTVLFIILLAILIDDSFSFKPNKFTDWLNKTL